MTTNAIRELRKRYKLTQKALSELTGIPKRTIESWEGGQRNPPEWTVALVKYYVEGHLDEGESLV